jgi:hypothetical protein
MVSLSPPVCDFGRAAIDFDLPGSTAGATAWPARAGRKACW